MKRAPAEPEVRRLTHATVACPGKCGTTLRVYMAGKRLEPEPCAVCAGAKIATEIRAKLATRKKAPDGSASEQELAVGLSALTGLVAFRVWWQGHVLGAFAVNPKTAVAQFPWGVGLEPARGFRSDFAVPSSMLLLEVEGKAHDMKRRGDVLRRQLAEEAGWRMLSLLPEQVRDGSWAELVQKAITAHAEGGRE